MELLLLEEVDGLGARGEIVTVARGYARNYLIPKNLAKVPNEVLVQEVRKKAARIEAENEAVKAERMGEAQVLAAISLTIPMKAGEAGHLYGSVGPRQIAEMLAELGHPVEEKHVQLDPPLKDVGEYDVSIALHPEVQVPVKVVIVAEEEA
jgi:large subunit ribosomal protein L9